MKQRCRQYKPVILIILDGWGIAPPSRGNAVYLAKPRNFNDLWKHYPHTELSASGRDVGLPQGQMGNSEAGHMNLGAGRRVTQDSVLISRSISDGTFFKNPAFKAAARHVKINHSRLHLMGLLSGDQSAHMYPEHLYALLAFAKKQELSQVYLHLFTDGRDSLRKSALEYLKKLEKVIKKIGIGKIATISGRYWAMDRVRNWSRTEKVYNAIVSAKDARVTSAREAILRSYKNNITDEFINPTVIYEEGRPVTYISSRDAIIFFNLRSDRARQLAKPFAQKDFDGFSRKKKLDNILFVAMTEFGPDLDVLTAYPARTVDMSLPRVLARENLKQLYIAEAEKYAHVTYFFNGGFADPVGGEDRIKIPSPKVKTYDQKPEMSAREVKDTIYKNIENEIHDFITVNFANPDMIGHTGNLKAGIKAVKFVDRCVGEIVKLILKKDGLAIITADHGNIEEMIYPKTGKISTSHSKNPVPFIIVSSKLSEAQQVGYGASKVKNPKLGKGILGDVTSTLLELMKIKKLKEMTEESLIEA